MRYRFWLILAVALLLWGGIRHWYDELQPERLLTRSDHVVAGEYRCVRIYEDPLSIVVEGLHPNTKTDKPFPVRLAGIRSKPNSGHGLPPNVYLARMVPPGQPLRLEFDRQRFDRDSFPLAYVLVEGRLINAELVSAGLAVPDPLPGSSSPWQKQICLSRVNPPRP